MSWSVVGSNKRLNCINDYNGYNGYNGPCLRNISSGLPCEPREVKMVQVDCNDFMVDISCDSLETFWNVGKLVLWTFWSKCVFWTCAFCQECENQSVVASWVHLEGATNMRRPISAEGTPRCLMRVVKCRKIQCDTVDIFRFPKTPQGIWSTGIHSKTCAVAAIGAFASTGGTCYCRGGLRGQRCSKLPFVLGIFKEEKGPWA